MTKKPRRLFTDEQKAESVNIVKQSGKPVSQAAKEMGLTFPKKVDNPEPQTPTGPQAKRIADAHNPGAAKIQIEPNS